MRQRDSGASVGGGGTFARNGRGSSMKKAFLTVTAGVAIVAAMVGGCSRGSAGSSAASSSGPAPSDDAGVASAPAAPTAAARPIDVCSLLSAEQASAIVGVRYDSAKASPNGHMCTYMTTDAPIGMYIIVGQGAGDAAWQDQLATIRSDGGSEVKLITGVGDRAAGAGTELGVQSGDKIIDVHGGDPNGSTGTFTKSVEVAKAIIARMH